MGRKLLKCNKDSSGKKRKKLGGRPKGSTKVDSHTVINFINTCDEHLTMRDIAIALGCSFRTMYCYKRDNVEIGKALVKHNILFHVAQTQIATKNIYDLMLDEDSKMLRFQASKFYLLACPKISRWGYKQSLVPEIKLGEEGKKTDAEQEEELLNIKERIAKDFKKHFGKDIETVMN